MGPLALALLSPAALLLASGAGQPPLQVRASEAAAPCAAAAARAYPGPPVRVEAGSLADAPAADVLVGSGVEVTRAIESGGALDDSETDVARIPWVFSVAAGGPPPPERVADLPPSLDLVVLGGPAAYEARRALAAHPRERVHETTDPLALRGAPLALLPLSLAAGGALVRTDLPPLVVRAVASARTPRLREARGFVSFLGSEAGQAAFAACGPEAARVGR